MADYENLLDSIDAVIRSNNRREITGQILQNTLHQMVGSLGENYQLAGFATPTLDPNSPDQNVFYVTDEAGVYTNFDNITLGAGLSFLMWKNEEWTSKTLDIVTANWVDEHYVSKEFLRKVFQFFDEDGVEIFPNDTESVVDNIKAMCGLWTNEYLSALGLGEGSTIPTTLAALNDVTITNPQDGQALVYDLASSHWVNRTIQSGVDMSVVWAALAAATNEQINISHLTTALNDYVTATSLATTLQSYVTTSALATELANYASQSWVETNYVSKAFFNSLFEAQDVNGNAITPNNSGQTTIDRLKILVGAYTEQYLSALGLSSGGGGGGSSTLAGLNDVTITNPQDGQALIYDAQSSHWVNGAAISMSAVWTALAAATSEQINSSHLTSALSGYVTTSALASELANYVTTSSLATTLADYVTTSALTTTLADYGSKTWIDNNYVSKAFFNRLFQAFAPLAEGQTEPTQVEPNDTTTTIDNIKAMFGLWTEQYLSALGLSSDAGHSIGVLDDLNDVTITNPQTNQVLKYNGTQWVNAAAPSGASALSGLTDVAISSLADKDLLQWDYATGKWKNVVLSTAMSAYALASAIPTNVSQLNNDSGFITSAALSGYALTSQIPTNNNQLTNGAGYVTSSGVTSIATGTGLTGGTITSTGTISINSTYQTYISHGESAYNSLGNYLPLTGGTITSGGNTPLTLVSTSNTVCGIMFKTDDTHFGTIEYYPSGAGYGTILTNTTGNSFNYVGIASDGIFKYNNRNIFIHDGNWSSYIGTSTSPVGYASVANSVAWTNVSNRPTNVSSFTNDSGYITSSALTDYLPLSGGTLTGATHISASVSGWVSTITNTSKAKLYICGTSYNGMWISSAGTSSDDYAFGVSVGDTQLIGAGTCALIIQQNGNIGINTATPLEKLHINGGCRTKYITDGGNSEYFVGASSDGLGGSYRGLLLYTYGSSPIVMYNMTYVGIGTKAPTYKLHVAGDIYATGGVTALSDIRKKDVTGYNLPLTVDQIAAAPTIKFTWKDKREEGEQVGTIAQYWQNVLPWVIKDKSGELSMQYGVAALISSITIARKVVDHEQRITELERENADLKQAYSFIKNAYDYLKMDYENLKLKIA